MNVTVSGLAEAPPVAWLPVAIIVALAIFFAWWSDTYTKDKF